MNIMKGIHLNLIILLVVASAALFTACKDDDDGEVIVDPGSLFFTADVASQSATVNAGGKDWDATANADWIHISKSNGSLSVTVDAYSKTESGTGRVGIVLVTAGSAGQYSLPVHQQPRHDLSIKPTSVTFKADEIGTKQVEVTTRVTPAMGGWTFTNPNVPWLKIAKTSNNKYLNFTVSELVFDNAPAAVSVTLSAGNAVPVTFQIKQEVSAPLNGLNTAEGTYLGDIKKTETAGFILNLFNASDPLSKLTIEGFGELPEKGAAFKLDAGAYFFDIAGTGEEQSLVIGTATDKGSRIYDAGTGKTVLLTGGTFYVAVSNDVYTITAILSGIDSETKDKVENLRYTYKGNITFTVAP